MDNKAAACSRQESISFVKTFMAVFIPIIVSLMVFHLYIYEGKKENALQALRNLEVHRAGLLADTMREHFDWILADLNYCANRYLAASLTYPQTERALASLQEDFLIFIRDKGIYDQIRIIDNDGHERLRINYNGGAAYASAPEKLQNKSQRYYFKECMTLDLGQVYVSPVDLNVEHGKVEIPFKPMIRIGRPLIDGQGQKSGMVLLNYYGAHLLKHVSEEFAFPHHVELSHSGQTMLVNSSGYWLVAADKEDEWGFMFADRKERTFAKRYPEEWQRISTQDGGHILTANGFFAFATVQSPQVTFGSSGAPFGKIISFVSAARIKEIIYQERMTFYLLAFLLVTLAAVVSSQVAMMAAKKRRHEQELAHSAFTDPLTGLLNRRAFQQRLEQETSRVDRYGGQLFMILGDIDHFKKINDTHGHDAGDFILTKIAATLTDNLRSTDVLCRWGGEEFMVLVIGKASEDGKKVAEKLRKAVEDEVMSFKPRIQVTMSFGVCAYRPKMTMEDLIKCTDEMLYSAKRNGRNKVSVSGL